MFHRKSLLLLNVIVIVGLLLAACAPAVTTPTPEVKVVEATKIVESVTVATPTAAPPPPEAADTTKRLRLNMGPGDIPTIDPALATDLSSISIIEEVGVGLTRQNVTTTAIEPGMATDWKVSDDGLTYTFNLRTDVPWWRTMGSVVKVQDCTIRPGPRGHCQDVEYGILRTLSETASVCLCSRLRSRAATSLGEGTIPLR
jgi:oligopeptide transport system substrate-binding protein